MAQLEAEPPVVLPDYPGGGPEVQVDYPGYRSTRWRVAERPLVTLPEEFHALEGPVFGEDAIGEFDNDLTRQYPGEPIGERVRLRLMPTHAEHQIVPLSCAIGSVPLGRFLGAR